MQRELAMRNVVCNARGVKPSDFGIAAFAEQLDLGQGEDEIRVADLSVTEWERARLQVLPDRVQLGFKSSADPALTRRAVESFLTRASELASGAPIGFNVMLVLTVEEGDPLPGERLVDADALAKSLGGTKGRGGFTVVFHDNASRWWIELTPLPDEDNRWTFDFNRHFANPPTPGEERDAILDWFSEVEASTVAMFETISRGTDQ